MLNFDDVHCTPSTPSYSPSLQVHTRASPLCHCTPSTLHSCRQLTKPRTKRCTLQLKSGDAGRSAATGTSSTAGSRVWTQSRLQEWIPAIRMPAFLSLKQGQQPGTSRPGTLQPGTRNTAGQVRLLRELQVQSSRAEGPAPGVVVPPGLDGRNVGPPPGDRFPKSLGDLAHARIPPLPPMKQRGF